MSAATWRAIEERADGDVRKLMRDLSVRAIEEFVSSGEARREVSPEGQGTEVPETSGRAGGVPSNPPPPVRSEGVVKPDFKKGRK